MQFCVFIAVTKGIIAETFVNRRTSRLDLNDAIDYESDQVNF